MNKKALIATVITMVVLIMTIVGVMYLPVFVIIVGYILYAGFVLALAIGTLVYLMFNDIFD